MRIRDEIYGQDEPIKHIYFPLSGIMSIVTTANGETAEVATIGNEGMLGLPVFFRTDRIPMEAFAQVPGETLVMSLKDFQGEINDIHSELSVILYRYAQAVFTQVAQVAACNSTHDIQRRCARWLLMTHDRVDADEFPLTQQFLAQMLGVRRAGVSVAASALQKRDLIRYRSGILTVLDRRGLEKVSCDHYRMIRVEYERLFKDL